MPDMPEVRGNMNLIFANDWATAYCGDAWETIGQLSLPVNTVVITDPPYGITNNKWDRPVDVSHLWDLLRQFHTTIITASQPFSSSLVYLNIVNFRHEWIWVKNRGSNFANTVREPMKEHEHVLVFSSGKWTYNPQMQDRSRGGVDRARYNVARHTKSTNYGPFIGSEENTLSTQRVPSSVQYFNTEVGLHPTQKPIALMRYLIQTYTNAGDAILDPFMGSGTTLLAATQLQRRSIGIDNNPEYCAIAAERLAASQPDLLAPVMRGEKDGQT